MTFAIEPKSYDILSGGAQFRDDTRHVPGTRRVPASMRVPDS